LSHRFSAWRSERSLAVSSPSLWSNPIDLFATLGAAVRLSQWLQCGVEYLGEELEGVGGNELDSGAPAFWF
jgi:hypothetical protein